MNTIPLIPRKVLFGNPDRAGVNISHDGAYLSWLASRDGVMNVWVARRDNLAAAVPVTHDTGRGIRFYLWAYTNRHILYIQDRNGDENWRIYAAEVGGNAPADGAVKDLTPFDGVQAQVYAISPNFPNEIMIGLNQREAQWHDLYRLNILSGEMTLVQQNEGFAGFDVDDDYRLRDAARMTPDGGMEILRPGEDGWQASEIIPPEDLLTTNPILFEKNGEVQYYKDSRGRNTAALIAYHWSSGEKTLLAEDPLADAGDVLFHPRDKRAQAISFTYDRKRWQILDTAIQPDLDYLCTVADGELEIVARTLDDHFWVVLYVVDNGPVRFYLYDRERRQAAFLFTNRKALEELTLASMQSAVIESRDGLKLVVYYSLPPGADSNHDGRPDRPLPLALIPHGGPWGRDFWGYNSWHQWLANRGFAVLNVNFRSSTGLGKAFTNAGDRQWGEKIIEDQVDAVNWAIAQGIADPQKTAVMGGSFGGYSTLAGLTFTPELFACGVDLVGPSSLITLLESMPPYWKPMLEMFTTRVGDHRTEEGRALLKKHSPLTYVERIVRPLLIGQGANDPRVKQAESDQIVAAMQSRGIPVTYVLYPDEGHGFARPENNLSFNAIAEAFLAKVIGLDVVRYEPIGDDFANSSLKVLSGAEAVPGLAEALQG